MDSLNPGGVTVGKPEAEGHLWSSLQSFQLEFHGSFLPRSGRCWSNRTVPGNDPDSSDIGLIMLTSHNIPKLL